MTSWKCAAVLMVLANLITTSSRAAESVTGRWAANPTSCVSFAGLGVQSLLVVSNYAVRWQGDTCRISRMYKTDDTIYIQALCLGEAGEKIDSRVAAPARQQAVGDLGPWHARRFAALPVTDEVI
jgi:hypothetical protein